MYYTPLPTFIHDTVNEHKVLNNNPQGNGLRRQKKKKQKKNPMVEPCTSRCKIDAKLRRGGGGEKKLTGRRPLRRQRSALEYSAT
jgi:hypothetical protein